MHWIDPGVQQPQFSDFVIVQTGSPANIGELITESDLCGVERILHVLGNFGCKSAGLTVNLDRAGDGKVQVNRLGCVYLGSAENKPG